MKIEVDVDVQQIAKDILEAKEGYYSLKEEVKRELLSQIRNSIVCEIRKNLKIGEFKETYTQAYLTDTAKNIVEKELRETTEKYCQQWIEKNLKKILEEHIYSFFSEKLYPLLSRIIANSIVVNQEKLQEAWEDFYKEMQEIASSAYESGLHNAYREIKRNL